MLYLISFGELVKSWMNLKDFLETFGKCVIGPVVNSKSIFH